MGNVSDKSYKANKNTHFMFTLLLYTAVNTTIIEYNTNATCFDLH